LPEKNRSRLIEKANILVVDDNTSLCKTMSMILRRNGYAVTIAVDGQEAIDRVRERPFDVTFMDFKVSGMDGVMVCRRIREIRPDSVVIMMTGYSVEDLFHKALQEGAYAALVKPLNMEEVFRMINEIVERRRAGDLADAAAKVLEKPNS
jgi:CheY-like chemotaxis protein